MEWLESASNVATGILGYIGQREQRNFEKEQAAEERVWNESMMNKQNEWNLNMWNMTNEYNSPINQRKRLEEAGLNPLYYGLDGSSANGMESAQPLGYQRASMSGMENPIQAGLNAALANAQVENIRANTAKTNNENETETQRRENMKVDLDKAKQEVENLIVSKKLTEFQSKEAEKVLQWYDKVQEANIQYQDSMSALNDSTRNRIDNLLQGELHLQNASLRDFEMQWKKINAELEKIASETKLNMADLENYALIHAHSGAFGTGLSLINFLLGAIPSPDAGNPSEMSGDVLYPDMGSK